MAPGAQLEACFALSHRALRPPSSSPTSASPPVQRTGKGHRQVQSPRNLLAGPWVPGDPDPLPRISLALLLLRETPFLIHVYFKNKYSFLHFQTRVVLEG